MFWSSLLLHLRLDQNKRLTDEDENKWDSPKETAGVASCLSLTLTSFFVLMIFVMLSTGFLLTKETYSCSDSLFFSLIINIIIFSDVFEKKEKMNNNKDMINKRWLTSTEFFTQLLKAWFCREHFQSYKQCFHQKTRICFTSFDTKTSRNRRVTIRAEKKSVTEKLDIGKAHEW